MKQEERARERNENEINNCFTGHAVYVCLGVRGPECVISKFQPKKKIFQIIIIFHLMPEFTLKRKRHLHGMRFFSFHL